MTRAAFEKAKKMWISSVLWTIWNGYGMYIARGTPGSWHFSSGSRSSQWAALSFFRARASGLYGI